MASLKPIHPINEVQFHSAKSVEYGVSKAYSVRVICLDTALPLHSQLSFGPRGGTHLFRLLKMKPQGSPRGGGVTDKSND